MGLLRIGAFKIVHSQEGKKIVSTNHGKFGFGIIFNISNSNSTRTFEIHSSVSKYTVDRKIFININENEFEYTKRDFIVQLQAGISTVTVKIYIKESQIDDFIYLSNILLNETINAGTADISVTETHSCKEQIIAQEIVQTDAIYNNETDRNLININNIKIYYINVDDNIERRNHIENQLNNYSFFYERISAITPKIGRAHV